MRINCELVLFSVLAIGLTACSSEEAIAEPAVQISDSGQKAAEEQDTVAVTKIVVALDGEGLRLVDSKTGSTRLLAFGTDRAAVETAIAAQLGAVDGRSSNDECGAGPMDFSNFGDFTANFQDDRFVGWFLREGEAKPTLTTMSGVGIGTTRSEMAKSVAFDIFNDSTIGIEFHISGDEPGGFSGLFESEAPDARITDLWAGTSCIFR